MNILKILASHLTNIKLFVAICKYSCELYAAILPDHTVASVAKFLLVMSLNAAHIPLHTLIWIMAWRIAVIRYIHLCVEVQFYPHCLIAGQR